MLRLQGTVMESIARTWGRKGALGFFSGNSAGTAHAIAVCSLNSCVVAQTNFAAAATSLLSVVTICFSLFPTTLQLCPPWVQTF